MITVVLGMHKSGTTLVSEILHKSGINIVESYDESVGYYKGNKMERLATLEMNHKILKSKFVSSLDIDVKLDKIILDEYQIQEMRNIIGDCNAQNENWGFKDPRTCFTYPLWDNLLPDHKIIFVYRHPAQVMHHYQKRSTIFNKYRRNFKSIQKWKLNNKALLKIIKTTNHPYLVINYADLMSGDEVFLKLQEFVGVPLFDARNPKISKNLNSQGTSWKFYDKLSRGDAYHIYHQLESFKEHS